MTESSILLIFHNTPPPFDPCYRKQCTTLAAEETTSVLWSEDIGVNRKLIEIMD